MKPLIAPSILAADFGNLQRDIEMINQSEADWVHFDVMDGNFVPNISFGFPILEVVKKHAQKPLDVHLMINNPESYIEGFARGGASVITVHYEATNHLHRLIEQIKEAGCQAGVSVNPHTSVSLLEDVAGDADLFLIMSVNPGFGGQKFITNSLRRISTLKEILVKNNSKARIEIDGGVNIQNAPDILRAGADVLVAGSFVFKSENPLDTIKQLKNVI